MPPPNIYIIGAQCTGKTTLVNNLASPFSSNPPVLITEVARTVLKEHHFTAADVVDPFRSLGLQRLILQAQVKAESEAVSDGRWFISDRSGLDPIVYARRYVGANTLADSEEWKELKGRMKSSLVIVCEAGEGVRGWLRDDGVRLMPRDMADWVAVHRQFCALLEEQGLEYAVLPTAVGGHEERVNFVMEQWRKSA
ncbi:hypothetical protein OQA88_603 [Cercophora sp. LCS_1]